MKVFSTRLFSYLRYKLYFRTHAISLIEHGHAALCHGQGAHVHGVRVQLHGYEHDLPDHPRAYEGEHVRKDARERERGYAHVREVLP